MTKSRQNPKAQDEQAPREHEDVAPQADETEDRARPTLSHWRAAVVAFAVCSMFGAVMARAYHIQVRRAQDLSQEAASQLAGVVEIRARRGAIYDRNDREMAISVRAESIFARPSLASSPRDTAAALAPLLGLSELALFESLTRERNFVWLSRRVSPRIANQVRELDLPGIDSMSEWQRFYPMRIRAGHLLGFTGDDGYGLEGIESALDETLAGEAMEVRGLRDALGRPILTMEGPELQAMEGHSIVLTLDARLQRIAERELERVVTEQQARAGLIVVMDPDTGEVLSMTNWPLFDPNRFRTSRPQDWRNRTVTDAWEPGSTMKIFTYAAGLDAGVIQPDTIFDVAGGRLRIGRDRIHDLTRRDQITARQMIQISSNIGAYRVASLLGDTGLYDAYRRFGFGEPTHISLGGEQGGILASPPWVEIELANRAFGHGVSVTALQLAVAYSALANGGELMRPMIIREIRTKDGEVIERFEPEVRHRVVSERTARLATEALETVTGESGTAMLASIPGIRVAGKSGTPQKANLETGGYDDRWMATFIGYVPADDPMFTIVVVVDEPQVGHYGGEVAGPVFARVAEQALATRGIFSTRTDDSAAEPPPLERGEGADLTPVPEPLPLDLSPLPMTVDARPSRVIVPDLTGLEIIDALQLSESMGLGLEVHEWGQVQRQWPAPGASVLEGSRVDVFMSAPYRSRWSGARERLALTVADALGVGRIQVVGDGTEAIETTVRFSELTKGVTGERLNSHLDPEIHRIAVDSRQIEHGDLFLALTGGFSDAHQWAEPSVESGAAALVLEHGGAFSPTLLESPPDVPILIVDDSRTLLADLANRFNGYPTKDLTLLATTGTNGKTTISAFLESIFWAAGIPCGFIGTLFFRLGGWEIHGRHTTPQAHDLFALLSTLLDRGAQAVALEASSHGLALRRLDGALVDVGIFTNLGFDHLDWHGNLESYFAAKRRLFTDFLPAARQAGKPGIAVINADDPWGRRLLSELDEPIVRYGLDEPADVTADALESSPSGSRFELVLKTGERLPIDLPIAGHHNVSNALGAAAAAEACGISPEAIAKGLCEVAPISGRLERVARAESDGPIVFVDYAHTPDALEQVIGDLRNLGAENLWVVFGCGGDRDRKKRPEMGRIAASGADVVVVTNDNPRSEDPSTIIDAILEGVRAAGGQQISDLSTTSNGYLAIEDRRAAIELAVGSAPDGAVVLIAGKGHETTQQIGDQTLPFDDRDVTRSALDAWSDSRGGRQ